MEAFRILETVTNKNFLKMGLNEIEIPRNQDDSLDDKKKYFQDALNRFGVKLASDDFVEKIESDDVVEIYMPDMNQVYRSLNFFKTCSYEPEYLFKTPWYELFRRAESMNEKIFGFMAEIMEKGAGTTEYPMGTHYLKETRAAKNVTRIEPGYVCSLLDDDTGAIFGIASILKATNVSDVIPLL